MSDVDIPREHPGAPTGLASQVDALAALVSAIDARSAHRHSELDAKLDTILAALALIHDDDPGARRRLQELRARADYDKPFTDVDPLVSVVIPTWNRLNTLIDRAIPSALDQTHRNLEVIVVGDCSPPEVPEAITKLSDPRVSFHNLTVRGPYDDDPHRAWLASGTPAINAGVQLARGMWIAPLGDDDAFVPEHITQLLSVARNKRLEFVYGRIRYTFPDGRTGVLGEFPPRVEQFGLQAAIYHTGLRFLELELGHALFGKPNDWGLIHRMMRIGVRIGMDDHVSSDYWPSMRALQRQNEKPLDTMPDQLATVETRLAELQQRLANEHHRSALLDSRVADLARQLHEVRRSRSWRLTAPLRRLRSFL